MRAVAAFVEARGFDTIATITPVSARNLRAAGRDFAMRYLPTLTLAEVQALTQAGIGVMGVCYGPSKTWFPSPTAGTVEGGRAVAQAKAAGLVAGTYLWFDLEGLDGRGLSALMVSQHVNAWARAVKAGGFGAGLYVGEGHLLTSAELYALEVDRYWQGCSRLVDRLGNIAEPGCGWCVRQLFPDDVIVAGVEIDRDIIQADFLRRLPVWTAA